MANRFPLWGQAGWASAEVVGETHYAKAIRALFGSDFNPQGTDIAIPVQLIPDRNNRHDRNAVGVWAGSSLLGHLPRLEAARYVQVLTALTNRGLVPEVNAQIHGREWGEYEGRPPAFVGTIRLDLAEPHMLVPANTPPVQDHRVLPPGSAVQVNGQQQFLEALRPLLRPEGECWAYVTLHEMADHLIEVRLGDARVGDLSPKMSGEMLPSLRHLAEQGLVTVARAIVKGNATETSVMLYVARAQDLPESWQGAAARHAGHAAPVSPAAGRAVASSGSNPGAGSPGGITPNWSSPSPAWAAPAARLPVASRPVSGSPVSNQPDPGSPPSDAAPPSWPALGEPTPGDPTPSWATPGEPTPSWATPAEPTPSWATPAEPTPSWATTNEPVPSWAEPGAPMPSWAVPSDGVPAWAASSNSSPPALPSTGGRSGGMSSRPDAPVATGPDQRGGLRADSGLPSLSSSPAEAPPAFDPAGGSPLTEPFARPRSPAPSGAGVAETSVIPALAAVVKSNAARTSGLAPVSPAPQADPHPPIPPAPTGIRFAVPPGWPVPPSGWYPPEGWRPDPGWPLAPSGWQWWVPVWD